MYYVIERKNNLFPDIIVHLNAVFMTVQRYEIEQWKWLKLGNEKDLT